jgi:hypothetical protein
VVQLFEVFELQLTQAWPAVPQELSADVTHFDPEQQPLAQVADEQLLVQTPPEHAPVAQVEQLCPATPQAPTTVPG